MSGATNALLDEQAEYYRVRAGEYDEWWQRTGRYDHGPEATGRWWSEVAEVQQALDHIDLSGSVVELACGTGWWTERLAGSAGCLTCIDASDETIAVNRSRIEKSGLPPPIYRTADLFVWEPEETYDVAFFSFWLSHVPAEDFDRFWAAVGRALKPGGRAFFIDSAPERVTAPSDNGIATRVMVRELNDGRTYRVVKQLYDPAELSERLDTLSWDCPVRRTERYFIYGEARRL